MVKGLLMVKSFDKPPLDLSQSGVKTPVQETLLTPTEHKSTCPFMIPPRHRRHNNSNLQ